MFSGCKRLLGFVVVAGLCLAAPLAAGAAPDEERQPTLPELEHALDEAVAEEASLLIAYQQATERRSELDAQVEELTAELRASAERLHDAEEELDRAAAEYVNANLRLDQVTGQLRASQDELRRQAVAAYTGGTTDEDLSVAVLNVDDVNELASGMVYGEAVVLHHHDLVTQVEALRVQVTRLAEEADEAREVAEGRRDEVAERTASLEVARQHLLDAQAAARQEEQRQHDLLDQVRARRADYEQRVAAQRAENARIAALLVEYQAALERQAAELAAAEAAASAAASAAAANAAAHLPHVDGKMVWPLPGATVTSGYGYRIHPIYHTRRLHRGLDMGGGMGDPIHVAAAGVVVLAGVNGGYGNCVVVYHGDGISTLYGHQSRLDVKMGDEVEADQVIGFVGSTGVSTGPHLHFEVRLNGNPVDPLPYL